MKTRQNSPVFSKVVLLLLVIITETADLNLLHGQEYITLRWVPGVFFNVWTNGYDLCQVHTQITTARFNSLFTYDSRKLFNVSNFMFPLWFSLCGKVKSKSYGKHVKLFSRYLTQRCTLEENKTFICYT